MGLICCLHQPPKCGLMGSGLDLSGRPRVRTAGDPGVLAFWGRALGLRPPRCRSLGRLAPGLRIGAFGGLVKLRVGDLAGPYGSGGPSGPRVCAPVPPGANFWLWG